MTHYGGAQDKMDPSSPSFGSKEVGQHAAPPCIHICLIALTSGRLPRRCRRQPHPSPSLLAAAGLLRLRRNLKGKCTTMRGLMQAMMDFLANVPCMEPPIQQSASREHARLHPRPPAPARTPAAPVRPPSQDVWPYFSVAALAPSNPFYKEGPTNGCGQCFQISCVSHVDAASHPGDRLRCGAADVGNTGGG